MSAAGSAAQLTRPSWGRGIVILSTYVVLGPPLGCVFVTAQVLMLNYLEKRPIEMMRVAETLLIGSFFSYDLGLFYAFLTGLLVLSYYLTFKRTPPLVALISPLVALYPGIELSVWAHRWHDASFALSAWLAYGFAGMMASLVCWSLFRQRRGGAKELGR